MSVRKGGKSTNASGRNGSYMSIREMSKLTGVPAHTLRFWEKQMPDVLSPERTPGGQRRYTAELVERVHAIRYLSEEKRYSLAAIRTHLAGAREIMMPPSENNRGIDGEQAIDLIVDEFAGLLKERLLHLLKSDELKKDHSPVPDSADLTPPPQRGGNDDG
jgi:DNA-binding transcriptional MerR regulator